MGNNESDFEKKANWAESLKQFSTLLFYHRTGPLRILKYDSWSIGLVRDTAPVKHGCFVLFCFAFVLRAYIAVC